MGIHTNPATRSRKTMTSPDKANDNEKLHAANSLMSSEDEGVKEATTGKEDSGEVKPAKKKMKKMEGCTIYSCKEEEAEEAKRKTKPLKKKKMKRCALDSCKTKLGLTAYQCRCERMFCPLHTPAEKHACS